MVSSIYMQNVQNVKILKHVQNVIKQDYNFIVTGMYFWKLIFIQLQNMDFQAEISKTKTDF